MQLAEHWIGNSVLALCSLSLLALAPRTPVAEQAPSPQIAEDELTTPERIAATTELPNCGAATYQGVFQCAKPALLECFLLGDDTRVDLVIDIARNGRVTHVGTRRSEPETPASRCLAAKVEHLTFPSSETKVVIMAPLGVRASMP